MVKENKEYMDQGVMLFKKIITYMYERQEMEQLIDTVETQLKGCGERSEKASELVLSNMRKAIDEVTHKLQKSLEFLPEMIDVIDAIASAIQEEDDLEIYTTGATNLLKYPDFLFFFRLS